MNVLMWILLKKPNFGHFTKKMEEQKNQTIGPLVSFQMFQKFMKDACMIKFFLILIKYFQAIFFSTQHILLTITEKMKISHENKQYCAAILTDLSKAFDCRPYDLAKLNAYGFGLEALKFIHGYLCDRSQKVKVGSSFLL